MPRRAEHETGPSITLEQVKSFNADHDARVLESSSSSGSKAGAMGKPLIQLKTPSDVGSADRDSDSEDFKQQNYGAFLSIPSKRNQDAGSEDKTSNDGSYVFEEDSSKSFRNTLRSVRSQYDMTHQEKKKTLRRNNSSYRQKYPGSLGESPAAPNMTTSLAIPAPVKPFSSGMSVISDDIFEILSLYEEDSELGDSDREASGTGSATGHSGRPRMKVADIKDGGITLAITVKDASELKSLFSLKESSNTALQIPATRPRTNSGSLSVVSAVSETTSASRVHPLAVLLGGPSDFDEGLDLSSDRTDHKSVGSRQASRGTTLKPSGTYNARRHSHSVSPSTSSNVSDDEGVIEKKLSVNNSAKETKRWKGVDAGRRNTVDDFLFQEQQEKQKQKQNEREKEGSKASPLEAGAKFSGKRSSISSYSRTSNKHSSVTTVSKLGSTPSDRSDVDSVSGVKHEVAATGGDEDPKPAVASPSPQKVPRTPMVHESTEVVTLNLPSGAVYEGQIYRGLMHGLGVLVEGDEKTSYSGYFQAGKREGQGLQVFASGDTYQGPWYQDVMHGEGGKYSYAGGDCYEGSWMGGQREGWGVHRYANGDIYEGHWQQDKWNGQGRFQALNGSQFEGLFSLGSPGTAGVLTVPLLAEGAQGVLVLEGRFNLEGQFIEGTSFNSLTGLKQEGEFLGGELHGNGHQRTRDGQQMQGTWQHGAPLGRLNRTSTEGRVFIEDYEPAGVLKRSAELWQGILKAGTALEAHGATDVAAYFDRRISFGLLIPGAPHIDKDLARFMEEPEFDAAFLCDSLPLAVRIYGLEKEEMQLFETMEDPMHEAVMLAQARANAVSSTAVTVRPSSAAQLQRWRASGGCLTLYGRNDREGNLQIECCITLIDLNASAVAIVTISFDAAAINAVQWASFSSIVLGSLRFGITPSNAKELLRLSVFPPISHFLNPQVDPTFNATAVSLLSSSLKKVITCPISMLLFRQHHTAGISSTLVSILNIPTLPSIELSAEEMRNIRRLLYASIEDARSSKLEAQLPLKDRGKSPEIILTFEAFLRMVRSVHDLQGACCALIMLIHCVHDVLTNAPISNIGDHSEIFPGQTVKTLEIFERGFSWLSMLRSTEISHASPQPRSLQYLESLSIQIGE